MSDQIGKISGFGYSYPNNVISSDKPKNFPGTADPREADAMTDISEKADISPKGRPDNKDENPLSQQSGNAFYFLRPTRQNKAADEISQQSGSPAVTDDIPAEKQDVSPKAMNPGTGYEFSQNGLACIFSEAHNDSITNKNQLIESMIDDSFSRSNRNDIIKRLGKFPERAIEILYQDKMKIHKAEISPEVFEALKKQNILVGGGYISQTHDVLLPPTHLGKFFEKFPRLSSMLEKPFLTIPAMLSTNLLILASTGILVGLSTTVAAPIVGLAGGLAGMGGIFISEKFKKINSHNKMSAPEHEFAHALDFALGDNDNIVNMKTDENNPKKLPMVGLVVSTHNTAKYKLENNENSTIPLKPTIVFLDDTGDRIPLSLKSEEILANYVDCLSKKEGAEFITPYAATTPMEYFAESVKAYVNTEKKNNKVTRKDLQEKDISMYNYLEKLFNNLPETKKTA